MASSKASFRHEVDDPQPLIATAHEYFDGMSLADAGQLDPNIADSDGLVSYVVASSNPPPPAIQRVYEEIAPVMEGLTNVVTSAVIKMSGKDANKRHDPNTWKGPMEGVTKAFCAGFSEAKKKYDQTIVGVEVATKFLNILMEAAVNEGAALNDFKKFLQSQGDTIRTEVSTGQQDYLYASVSIIHEIFQASDGRWIYVPKFKSYFTRFTQETFKLTSACVSVSKFRFAFDLQIMTGAFMVETWKNDRDFQEQVKAFIKKFQKLNIKDSANYFDGIFNSEQD